MERKKKIKNKRGKCVNCQREGMRIKVRGCCANCYDTPMRKGYKPGTPQWIACQAALKAKFDPLFRAAPEKLPEVPLNRRYPGNGDFLAPANLSISGGEEPEEAADDRAGAPGPLGPSPGAETDKTDREAAAPEKGQKSMTTGLPEEGIPWETPGRDRYLSLLFGGEDSADQRLFAWLRRRAAKNRRGMAAEVMNILDSMANKEDQLRQWEAHSAACMTERQKKASPIAENYAACMTAREKKLPKGLTLKDKLTLGVVIGFVTGFLTFLIGHLLAIL